MAKKVKKRLHPMPPLSFIDKLIYRIGLLLLCAAYLFLLFGPLQLRHRIAYSDITVVAVYDNASLLWLLVPWMTFFLMTFILWLMAYQDRKPIFGKRNFKYGPPAWDRVYPLFMKDKPYVWVSEKKRQEKKQIATALSVVLLVSFIPFPWSLYGRECLRTDGSIIQYNMFNGKTREFTKDEIAEVTIETYRYRVNNHRNRYWGVQMVFRTETGKKYTFNQRTFDRNLQKQPNEWLVEMLRITRCYDPGIIHYCGFEDIDRVIADKNLSQEEIGMLYQLFGRKA